MDWDPHGVGRTFVMVGFLIIMAFVGIFFLGRASSGCSCNYRIVRVK